jgi:4'-phosphopantetheinyl transferase EntD
MSSAVEPALRTDLVALSETTLERAASAQLGMDFVFAISNEPLPVEYLNPGEAARCAAFLTRERELEYLRGRAALNRMFERLGEDRTPDINFPNPRFSLTHSRNVAVAVAARSRALKGIGVDLEIDRLPRPEAAGFFLTTGEQGWVERLTGEARPQALLSLWTVKESLFKADPSNRDRMLRDYCVESPGAAAGRAFVCSDETIVFKYCRFGIEGGGLAVAILLGRGQNG